MDAIRYGFRQVFEKLLRHAPVSLVDQMGNRELASAVDADKQAIYAADGSTSEPSCPLLEP